MARTSGSNEYKDVCRLWSYSFPCIAVIALLFVFYIFISN